jgi:hypothetical protein
VEHAIERYKLALFCAVLKNARNSEKAIICLKTSWLYRDINDDTNEGLFIDNAYKFFCDAFGSESFPIESLSENAVRLIICELARRKGLFGEAMKLIVPLLHQKDTPKHLRAGAEDLRQLVRSQNSAKVE